MDHSFLPIILRLLYTLSLPGMTKDQDIITGIWNDDFKHDNGLTGWNIFVAVHGKISR